jgi:hypothetical protein
VLPVTGSASEKEQNSPHSCSPERGLWVDSPFLRVGAVALSGTELSGQGRDNICGMNWCFLDAERAAKEKSGSYLPDQFIY